VLSSSSSAGWRRAALALFAVFAIVNTANALNKGGDASVFFEGGRRLLDAAPLYAGSSAASGFIGPPFQALLFAPFAAIASVSDPMARLLWHALNLAALAAGIWCAWRVLTIARAEIHPCRPGDSHPGQSRVTVPGVGDSTAPAQEGPSAPPFPYLFAPMFAVLLPLQTNFEHQNMNALLFALIAGATWQLTTGAAAAAGILIGAATAIKAFPAILILWLLARRMWATALIALATAAALTLMPLAVYGPARFAELLGTFWRLGSSGWPLRGNNQSLVAAFDRLTSGVAHEGVRTAAEAPAAAWLFLAAASILVAAIGVLIAKTRAGAATIAIEAAAVTTLGVLLSPIAWDHYWTLLFPAFLFVYASGHPALLGKPGQWAFWIAAILTSGLSPLTLGSDGFNAARQMSVDTLAGLILFVALVALHKATALSKVQGA
jgi:hypothetical protein